MSGERATTHEYQLQLVAALEAKAAQELRAAQIHYERRLIRPAVLVLFVTLLALLIFVVAAPVAFTALTRAAFPFSNAHYTHVQVIPRSRCPSARMSKSRISFRVGHRKILKSTINAAGGRNGNRRLNRAHQ